MMREVRWLVASLFIVASHPPAVFAQLSVLEDRWVSPSSCDAIHDLIRVEPLDDATWVLRESPCVDREAPFLFLLIGTERALLVDSGTQDGVALAKLVGQKLEASSLSFADLTLAHTHSHSDHRSGDRTLATAGALVVGPTVAEVREFWHLESWPGGVGSLDLGGRVVEVVPIPGHNDNSIALFDHRTRALLSGDSLLRGTVTVTDLAAFQESVSRLSRFVDRLDPVVVLGGHLERDGVPVGLSAVTVSELAELSERVSFVRPFASGDHFTILYMRPVLVSMGIGFLLLTGGLLRRFRRRKRSSTD